MEEVPPFLRRTIPVEQFSRERYRLAKWNAKDIQSSTNATIYVPKTGDNVSLLQISGKSEMEIDAALEQLLELMEVRETHQIPEETLPKSFYELLANNCAPIAQDTKTKITIPKDHSQLITISGSNWKSAVEELKALLPKLTEIADCDPHIVDLQDSHDTTLRNQLEHSPELKLSTKLDPTILSQNSAKLLDLAPSSLSGAMRLELREEGEDNWVLVLKFHPVRWFDVCLRDKSLEEKVRIAQQYLNEEKEAISKDREKEQETNFERPEMESPDLCRNHSTCARKRCNFHHSSIYCSTLVTRRGAVRRECKFSYSENLEILPPDAWLLMTRMEYTRDLLLLPSPMARTKNDNWKGHYVNSELCRMPFMWKSLFEKTDKLEAAIGQRVFESIALNFGVWESGQELDHRALDCHGHVHINLTKDAAIALGALGQFAPLQGRTNRPKDYQEENIEQLETKRLFSLQLSSLQASVFSLKASVKGLRESVKCLRESVNSLKASVKGLRESVNSILAILQRQFPNDPPQSQ